MCILHFMIIMVFYAVEILIQGKSPTGQTVHTVGVNLGPGSNWENFYSPLDGMLVHCRVTPGNIKVVFYWGQLFLVRWVGWVFCVLLERNLFRLVWLINFFNQPPTRLKRLKKHLRDYTV